MHYVALATDYDGTIATDSVVPPSTLEALERLRTLYPELSGPSAGF